MKILTLRNDGSTLVFACDHSGDPGGDYPLSIGVAHVDPIKRKRIHTDLRKYLLKRGGSGKNLRLNWLI